MFSGIVESTGRILKRQETAAGLRLTLEGPFRELMEGESIAVDGVCLTVVTPKENLFLVDLSPETLEKTTAQHWTLETSLNMERSLRMGDRNGGHFVYGHVDLSARVEDFSSAGDDYMRLRIGDIPPRYMCYLLPKGSVAVNGVSLTINAVTESGFEVMLIPHTLEKTNLKGLKTNTPVNIEFDWMTKTIIQRVDEHLSANQFTQKDSRDPQTPGRTL